MQLLSEIFNKKVVFDCKINLIVNFKNLIVIKASVDTERLADLNTKN